MKIRKLQICFATILVIFFFSFFLLFQALVSNTNLRKVLFFKNIILRPLKGIILLKGRLCSAGVAGNVDLHSKLMLRGQHNYISEKSSSQEMYK